MIPWKTIDAATVPGSGESLQLRQRGDEFSIRGNRYELMNSRMHGSEETLATLACQAIAGRPRPRILIGGLGMGYTLAAALAQLSNDSRVTVAELVPAVVQWNRGPLAHLAGHPLKDARVRVVEIDVAVCLRTDEAVYDAVILDIDNGPDGLTRRENDWIYGHHGVRAIHAALRPNGVLTVWSAAPVANRCPSSLIATAWTAIWCPTSGKGGVGSSQRRDVPSSPAVTNWSPCG